MAKQVQSPVSTPTLGNYGFNRDFAQRFASGGNFELLVVHRSAFDHK